MASSRVPISSCRVVSASPSFYCSLLGEFHIKLASKMALDPYTKKMGDCIVLLSS